jgi:hypothetical protein
MVTTQASPGSYRVSPPPVSAENPAELNAADLPANQDHPNQFATDDQVSPRESHGDQELSRVKEVEPLFPAGAYHVPPKAFTPSPNPPQAHEYSDGAKRLGTLPHRCQFMFSDGRQCTMARSDIHPSLCVYHSEREEQLFGDPFAESHVRGRSYDLPELFSAARDLTTAAGVNRALAQVFRLLAQRRISRQEAATFAKLGHLLLQSIRAAHAEGLSLAESHNFGGGFIPSQYNERGIPPEPTPERGVSSSAAYCESTPSCQHRSEAIPPSHIPANSSMPPIVPSPEPPSQRVAMSNPRKVSTSAAPVCNSPGISTYENTRPNPGLHTSRDKADIIPSHGHKDVSSDCNKFGLSVFDVPTESDITK